MKFRVYHPLKGECNPLCLPDIYEYECVAVIECKDITNVFKLAQNDFNEEYAKIGIRSTSVGDLIRCVNDLYIIRGHELQLISTDWLLFVDWAKHIYQDTDPNLLEPIPEEINYCPKCEKEECICLELENVREI